MTLSQSLNVRKITQGFGAPITWLEKPKNL